MLVPLLRYVAIVAFDIPCDNHNMIPCERSQQRSPVICPDSVQPRIVIQTGQRAACLQHGAKALFTPL